MEVAVISSFLLLLLFPYVLYDLGLEWFRPGLLNYALSMHLSYKLYNYNKLEDYLKVTSTRN